MVTTCKNARTHGKGIGVCEDRPHSVLLARGRLGDEYAKSEHESGLGLIIPEHPIRIQRIFRATQLPFWQVADDGEDPAPVSEADASGIPRPSAPSEPKEWTNCLCQERFAASWVRAGLLRQRYGRTVEVMGSVRCFRGLRGSPLCGRYKWVSAPGGDCRSIAGKGESVCWPILRAARRPDEHRRNRRTEYSVVHG